MRTIKRGIGNKLNTPKIKLIQIKIEKKAKMAGLEVSKNLKNIPTIKAFKNLKLAQIVQLMPVPIFDFLNYKG
jgi:hypothetical protein